MFKQFVVDNYGPVFFSVMILLCVILVFYTGNKRDQQEYNVNCMKLGYGKAGNIIKLCNH